MQPKQSPFTLFQAYQVTHDYMNNGLGFEKLTSGKIQTMYLAADEFAKKFCFFSGIGRQ